ncbi:MAG TPA: nucleotide exchange factor GrpE, partial [Verrucomicrobiae bacterium]|nr:nucleotide exchange factor GrpE [Verrucomicrobiae bacterium]
MSETQAAPRLQKWPFYLADLVLSGIAGYVLYRLGAVQNSSSAVISLACLIAAGWGAWLSISPWLLEYRTQSDLSESTNLKSSLEQIQNLEKVADSIRQANSQWQAVQDASGRTVVAAREIAERMKLETEEFMKFMDNAHEQERAGLRLEVEKLRRMEGDWIKVTVQMLDHVFALYRAAEKSGQQNLVSQLAQFQGACRDVARRMGLTPFLPVVGENFDSRGHQLTDAQATPAEGATVADILATGFTYQGQLLRRALVI